MLLFSNLDLAHEFTCIFFRHATCLPSSSVPQRNTSLLGTRFLFGETHVCCCNPIVDLHPPPNLTPASAAAWRLSSGGTQIDLSGIKDDPSTMRMLFNEIKGMKALSHPNIVRLQEVRKICRIPRLGYIPTFAHPTGSLPARSLASPKCFWCVPVHCYGALCLWYSRHHSVTFDPPRTLLLRLRLCYPDASIEPIFAENSASACTVRVVSTKTNKGLGATLRLLGMHFSMRVCILPPNPMN